jgi:hypothetical protein
VDLLLLLGQVALVVLLVVMPLFSGIDKWREWSWARRTTALALAIGVAAVGFGQYRRIVLLDKGGLQQALGNVGLFSGPWYSRRVVLSVWEYGAMVLAGALLMGMAFEALRRRSYFRAVAFIALFCLLLGLAVLVKLHRWRE